MPGVASRFSVIVAAAGFAEVECMTDNATTQLKTLPLMMIGLVTFLVRLIWLRLPCAGMQYWTFASFRSERHPWRIFR
jgi:hypothetical protein